MVLTILWTVMMFITQTINLLHFRSLKNICRVKMFTQGQCNALNLILWILECNLFIFSNVSLLGKWWHVDFLTHCGQWKRWKKMCFQSSTPWSNFHKTRVSRIVVFFVNFLYCIRINITAFWEYIFLMFQTPLFALSWWNRFHIWLCIVKTI